MLMMKTRASGNAPGLPGLPPPAPLPGLVGAFSRRAALFGAVTATGFLAASAPNLVAAIGGGATGSVDARLEAIADELHALDAACDAHASAYRSRKTDASEAEIDEIVSRYNPLEEEMADLPAASLAGVLAKVRVLDIPTCRDCESGIAESVVADIRRLHAAGVLA